MKGLLHVSVLVCLCTLALAEHSCRDDCNYGDTLGGVDLSHLKGIWETVYFSKSEGAIEDNEATFFNISVCGGIKGDGQPKECTGSPTSVCMRSSDNAMFALADTASCDVTYNSTKRHVQFVYKYSSSVQSTFHNGTVMITLICGQHLGVPEVVYGDPHSGNIQIIWVTSAVCTQERQPVHENKCYAIGSNSAAGIDAEIYDLSYLIKPTGYKLKSDSLPNAEFVLSLCHPLDVTGKCNGSMFCLTNGSLFDIKAPYPIAFITNSSSLRFRNGHLIMEYYSNDTPDVCNEDVKDGNKVHRKVEIRFLCPSDNEVAGPRITFIDGKVCLCTIEWYTSFACGMSAIESTSCVLKDRLTKKTRFDLTELGRNLSTALVTGADASKYTYHLSVCSGPGVDVGDCPIDNEGSVVRVSQEYSTSCKSLGSDPGKLKYADGALTLTYSYGDRCHTNFARTTIINFFCPKDVKDFPSNATSRLRFVEEDNCLYTFEWVTPLACPKEEVSDASACGFDLGGASYNLAQLIPEGDKNWLVVSSKSFNTSCYMISSCGNLVISGKTYATGVLYCLNQKAPTSCSGYSVCQIFHNGTGRPLGAFDVTNSSTVHSISDGVFLLNSTKLGALCPGKRERTYSTMTYVCKPGALVDPPVLVENYYDCIVEFQWQTAVACPLAHYHSETGNCKIKDKRLDYEYDLSSLNLTLSEYSHTVGVFNYTMNVCGYVECGDKQGVGMCQHDSGNHHSVGLSNSTLEYENGVLKMVYSGGDKCHNGQERNTTIIFQCDHSHPGGLIIDEVEEVSHCVYEVTVLTNLACPPNYRAIECVFEDKKGQQYDFSQLAKEKFNWEASGTESANVTYLINVCRPLNKAPGCSPTSAVCEYALPTNGSGSDRKKFLHNLGDASTGHFQAHDNGSVMLHYHLDPPAGSKECQRLVTIHFECDKHAELDTPPRFLAGGDNQSLCQCHFTWRTRAACPVTTETVENSCKITDTATSYTYDLTPLRTTTKDYTLTGADGHSYWINLCGALVDSKSCSKQSTGCQTPKGSSDYYSLGTSDTQELKYLDGSIVLTYKGGSVCHHNNRPRVMELTFQCDAENSSRGVPHFREENECLYRFLWPTVLACKPTTIDCIVEGGKYDLRPLFTTTRNWHIQNSVVYKDRDLYMSVCQPLNVTALTGNCPDGAAACEVYKNGSAKGLGGVYSDLKVISEGLLSLTYSNGKRCPDGDIGKVVTLFKCNHKEGTGEPRIVSVTDNCEYEMEWETAYACPIGSSVTHGNCSILDPLTGSVVNISRELKTTFFSVNTDHFIYNITICGKSLKCDSSDKVPHGGCQIEKEGEKRQFSIGMVNESSLKLVEGKLSLTYEHGKKCHHNDAYRKTVINFECDRNDTQGTLKFIQENNCEYVFTFSTNLDIVCHKAVPKVDCNVAGFDLSPIANVRYLHYPIKIQISKEHLPRLAMAMVSICHPLNHSNPLVHNCTPGQAACLKGHGLTIDLGQPTGPPVAMKDGEGVEITYKNGGPCSKGGTRHWTVLRIVCDREVGLLSTLNLVGAIPSEETCEFVFEVKSRAACWLNHTTTSAPTTITTNGSINVTTGSKNTSSNFSPTLCRISDPAFTTPVSFGILDRPKGLTPTEYEYKVRLCGPLPTDLCGPDSGICIASHRIVYAEHYIVPLSSTSVGFYFPWGPKCMTEHRNVTATVVVHCGGYHDTYAGPSFTYTHYYKDLCEHRFSLATPSMCFSDSSTLVQCAAQDKDSTKYDLTSIVGHTWQGVVLPKSSSPVDVDVTGTFNFTVCRSLNPLTDEGSNCDPGNAICVKSIKGGYIGLGHMKKAPQISSEGHVMLYYEGGSQCGDEKDGVKYSAKIHLICSDVPYSSAPRIMSRPEKCVYEIEWHHKIACKPHYDKAEAKKCLFNDTTTDTVIDLQPLLNFTVNTSTSDGTGYSVTACGKVVRTKGSTKTTLGEYSGSFDVYSAQGIQLDYSGDHDDKCQDDYQYSSTVIMECSHGLDGAGRLTYNEELSSKCHYYFTWWTMYACTSTDQSCSVTVDGKFYDFTELHHSSYWSVTHGENEKFKINICGPIKNLPPHTTGCSSDAAVCLQINRYQQTYRELARADTQVISVTGQGRSRKILLVYSGAAPTSKSYIDDKCSSYHVKIIMNCGSLSAKPMELVAFHDCTYTFQWTTSLACPEQFMRYSSSVKGCSANQIPADKNKNTAIFLIDKMKKTGNKTNNYYTITPEEKRFFINICAPVLPQHLYDLSSCGDKSAVCMVTDNTATSLVSTTDPVTFIYEDRWLEIEMGQSGKNKVVIHVECIHDPIFEIANYQPAGTEHLEYEYNSTSKGVTTYHFTIRTFDGCKFTNQETEAPPTTASTTASTITDGSSGNGRSSDKKKSKASNAGAAVAIVIVLILVSLGVMSTFLFLRSERRRSKLIAKTQSLFKQTKSPPVTDAEMKRLIPTESGDSGKDESSSEEEHHTTSSGEDEELMDL